MIDFFKKNFGKWFEIKPSINEKKLKPQFLKAGMVWWYHCGENIGSEICGKGNKFFRPCIIYKVLSQRNILIIPLTTNCKKGSWYIPIESLQRKSVGCLHQISSIDIARLDRKMGQLKKEELENIYEKFKNLYIKIDPLQ